MATLRDQILGRFSGGDPIGRTELAVEANYDSVGRVLRQLVADRQLVRVGRGRYRKASGSKAGSAATIAALIQRRIGRSRRNVFLRSDFAEFGSYDAIGRALRKLTESGRLVPLGHGLYAKAAKSPFTGKPAPLIGIRRLAAEALRRLGKAIGTSSFEDAYNAGRSTQVPTGRTVGVKDRVRRRIGYDGHYVILERT